MTISETILSMLHLSGRGMSLDNLRSALPHISYAGLRYHLMRLQERGCVERTGDTYRLP